jgi:cysteinyl-tRNA synthetase
MATKYLGTEFDIHGGGMDLMFPHHESEIAQSTICNKHMPARYWLHNNMITVAGKKMGKSYNNQVKLTEMFGGDHPLLTQAFGPMTIRFFILQTHYRSTLDFSNDALVAAEKGLKRLWEAYEVLMKLPVNSEQFAANDTELEKNVIKLIAELDEFMNDDFNTAKVLANIFEIVPIINSIKDGIISPNALSATTIQLLQTTFKTYLEDIFGLKNVREHNETLNGVMQLMIDIRKEAKSKKDFATSDRIRKQLSVSGITLKDNKDGGMSWDIS